MLLTNLRLIIAAILTSTVFASNLSHAASQGEDIPAWLRRHVGHDDGQIAPVVLQRARMLYRRKVGEGAVRNPCYLAMDATRPNTMSGQPGRRFYIVCEAERSFRSVSSGHGNGRKLRHANFSNGRQCAKNFSNAEGSNLTAGGAYITAEIRQSFKGYYSRRNALRSFVRPFLVFDGEGETANSRERDIGGHQAVYLKPKCRYQNPTSPYADTEGFVPFGRLVDYTSGRSNGCTTWSRSASEQILSWVEDDPTTLYIYPESRDIQAVAHAVLSQKSLLDKDL